MSPDSSQAPQKARRPAHGPVSPVTPRRSTVAAWRHRRIRASRTKCYLAGISCSATCTPEASYVQAIEGSRKGATAYPLVNVSVPGPRLYCA